ncbi:MAG: hypothetical protein WCO77_09950, partial [bacterium]
ASPSRRIRHKPPILYVAYQPVEKVLTLIISAGGRGLPSRGPNDRMTIEPLVFKVDRSLFMLASGHGSASLALQAPCARFVFQQAPMGRQCSEI